MRSRSAKGSRARSSISSPTRAPTRRSSWSSCTSPLSRRSWSRTSRRPRTRYSRNAGAASHDPPRHAAGLRRVAARPDGQAHRQRVPPHPHTGRQAEQVGRMGASPDRLVGDDGQLELKCPSPETHVRYLLFPQKGVDAEYRVQVQGQLYVTKRAWCDVVSYHPDLPSVIVRVERDEEYIALLAEALTTFCAQLAEGKAELERRGLLKVEGERTSTRTRRPSTEHQRPMTFNEQILHYLDHGMRD